MTSHDAYLQRRYVGIVGYPRTGSNLLMDVLLANSQAFGAFEFFHHVTLMEEFRDKILERYGDFERFRAASQIDPIGTMEAVFQNNDRAIFIYKVFPHHLSDDAFRKALINTDVFIFMKRNLLASWTSDVIATKSQTYYEYFEDQSSTRQQWVRWDPGHFVDWSVHILEFMSSRLRECNQRRIPTMEVSYAEAVSRIKDPSNLWRDLGTAACSRYPISLPPSFLPQIKQQNTKSAMQRFENPDQVTRDLNALGLGFMLDGSDRFDYFKLLDYMSAIQYEHGFYQEKITQAE